MTQSLTKNRGLFLAAIVAISAVVPLSSAHAQTTRPTFVSKKHGFSLYLPQKPGTMTRPKPAALGGGTLEVFGTPLSPVSYSIVPIVLPRSAAKLSQKTYFDSVQVGILQASGGKAVSSKTLLINSQTVRSFVYSFATPTATSKKPIQFTGETRIYKKGARTYQFTALVQSNKLALNKAQINKVFNSIRIDK